MTDIRAVLENEIKEWHFHIYFLQTSATATAAAVKLRDAVLRLRHQGAFVAVPLNRVNYEPIGPHPVGSYEIWCPSESFSSVFSYLALNRGPDLSILIHPLTRDQRADHEVRPAWIGPSFPLNLEVLPIHSNDIPLQYPSLKLGYSTEKLEPSVEERRKAGEELEQTLQGEDEAAPAP